MYVPNNMKTDKRTDNGIPNFLGSEFLLYTLVKPILGTFSQKLQCDQLFDQMSSLCKSILLENYDIS